MFIPIRTDYRMRRRPWVNYGLIAANVVIFMMGYHGMTQQGMAKVNSLLLHPNSPELGQFFSSMFLHGGWMHLIGNMLFLWVFGNAINDRFGHVGYLMFYLAGGVLAGVGYIALSGRAPVLGASGAISAVTGAYLVLFPRVRVTLLIWFYFVTFVDISSLYFLAFQFVWNMVLSVPDVVGPQGGGGGVAYVAHSSGYVFGIAISAAMLALRALPREPYDLLNLIQSHSRRKRYRRMVSQGFDPFGRGPTAAPPQHVASRTVSTESPDTIPARQMELRRQISADCSRNDLAAASDKYLQLIQIAEDAVLARQPQLDVANHLMSSDRHAAAADAYERFVRHYGNYEHLGDINLMLGLLYGRYLQQYDRAETCLTKAIEALHEDRKLQMARDELAAVRHRRKR